MAAKGWLRLWMAASRQWYQWWHKLKSLNVLPNEGQSKVLFLEMHQLAAKVHVGISYQLIIEAAAAAIAAASAAPPLTSIVYAYVLLVYMEDTAADDRRHRRQSVVAVFTSIWNNDKQFCVEKVIRNYHATRF